MLRETTPSRDDFVVQAAARRHPIENLLVQFFVLSLAILAILAVALSVILTTRLDREFDLLKENQPVGGPASSGLTQGLSEQQLDTELSLLRWTVYVSVGGGFVILWVGLVWIVARGSTTINKQQLDLLKTNADLRAAYQEIREAQESAREQELRRLQAAQEAREQERQRLAEELHDETMAELASTVVDLGFLASRYSKEFSPELRGEMGELRERARGTERKLRQIVQGIFPSVLTNLGLMPALRTYIEHLSARPIPSPHRLELELKATGLDDGRLPEEIEVGLYRVIQQGVTNAIQHSQARKLRVDLTWVGTEVTLRISDDGVGFDVSNPTNTIASGHFGLVNLRDRISALDGDCEIESSPSVGTTIQARVPTHGRASETTDVRRSITVLGHQDVVQDKAQEE